MLADTMPAAIMTSTSAPNMDSIKIIFIDIPAGVAVDSIFELTTTYYDFTSLLSQMSGSVFNQIKGIPQDKLSGKGFIMSNGCWWYRIVKLSSSEDQEADSSLSQPVKGPWCRLTNLTSYNHLRENELASGMSPSEGWIEAQHVSPNAHSPRADEITDTTIAGPSEEARRSPCR
jgi:hypothetical protein